jgi:hypothetical protein
VVLVELLEPHLNPIDGTLKDFHFPGDPISGFSFGFHSRRTKSVHYQTLRRDGFRFLSGGHVWQPEQEAPAVREGGPSFGFRGLGFDSV